MRDQASFNDHAKSKANLEGEQPIPFSGPDAD